MLETFDCQTFTPLLGERFEVEIGEDQTATVELVKASQYAPAQGPSYGSEFRTPFSILFRGSKDFLIRQGTYPIHHPELGRFELFIVPVIPDSSGHLYEAVFG
jgi:hypothetical protein